MGNEKKDALLAVAERLFARNGYRDICVRDIAAAAGMGTASFYTYFPGKESLYEEIIDRLERKGISELSRRVENFKSPLNKLRALFRSVVSSLRGNVILIGVYSGQKLYTYPGSEKRSLRGNPLLGHIEGVINGILAEGARKGIFRTDVFRNPAQVLMTVFRSLLTETAVADVDDLIQDACLLVERGLKRWIRLRMRDERLDRRASRIP
jgi:AcrR family transcriptional regulator